MRFLDPNVGRISRVPVSSGEPDVVPIRPISARFFGKEGTLLQRTQILLIYIVLGCNCTQGTRPLP